MDNMGLPFVLKLVASLLERFDRANGATLAVPSYLI